MGRKIKDISVGLLITVSFVLFIGIVSSIAILLLENPSENMALISGIAQVLYLLLVLAIMKIKKVNIKSECRLNTIPLKATILACLTALCFSSFSSIIQQIAPINKKLLGNMSNDIGSNIFIYIVVIFIIGPIVEEFVFRGLLISKLKRNCSCVVAVFISGLLFGLTHFMTGSVVTVIHAFLGGLIFALTYVKIGSLFSVILAHAFGNVGGIVSVILVGFSVKIQSFLAVVFLIIMIVSFVLFIKSNKTEVDNLADKTL